MAPHPDSIASIDEEMRKIGFKSLTRTSSCRRRRPRGPSLDDDDDEDDLGGPHGVGGDGEREEGLAKSENKANGTDPVGVPLPQSPTSINNILEENSPDYQTVMRLLEAGENITHMYRCARIQGLDTTEGLLLFGEHCFLLTSLLWSTNVPILVGVNSTTANFKVPYMWLEMSRTITYFYQLAGQISICKQMEFFS